MMLWGGGHSWGRWHTAPCLSMLHWLLPTCGILWVCRTAMSKRLQVFTFGREHQSGRPMSAFFFTVACCMLPCWPKTSDLSGHRDANVSKRLGASGDSKRTFSFNSPSSNEFWALRGVGCRWRWMRQIKSHKNTSRSKLWRTSRMLWQPDSRDPPHSPVVSQWCSGVFAFCGRATASSSGRRVVDSVDLSACSSGEVKTSSQKLQRFKRFKLSWT